MSARADHCAALGKLDWVMSWLARRACLEALAWLEAGLKPARPDKLHVGPCLDRAIFIML
jgi:hypothetical protein